MNMSDKIARLRLHYHATACDLNNVLNQLHILSDEKAEQKNCNHVMIIVNDIAPRLGKDVAAISKKRD